MVLARPALVGGRLRQPGEQILVRDLNVVSGWYRAAEQLKAGGGKVAPANTAPPPVEPGLAPLKALVRAITEARDLDDLKARVAAMGLTPGQAE